MVNEVIVVVVVVVVVVVNCVIGDSGLLVQLPSAFTSQSPSLYVVDNAVDIVVDVVVDIGVDAAGMLGSRGCADD